MATGRSVAVPGELRAQDRCCAAARDAGRAPQRAETCKSRARRPDAPGAPPGLPARASERFAGLDEPGACAKVRGAGRRALASSGLPRADQRLGSVGRDGWSKGFRPLAAGGAHAGWRRSAPAAAANMPNWQGEGCVASRSPRIDSSPVAPRLASFGAQARALAASLLGTLLAHPLRPCSFAPRSHACERDSCSRCCDCPRGGCSLRRRRRCRLPARCRRAAAEHRRGSIPWQLLC